jgi:hypothetical protein
MPEIFQYLVKNKAGGAAVCEKYTLAELAKRLTVRDEYNNRYLVFDAWSEFTEWNEQTLYTQRCFHEVIFGQLPQRIKFDIDATLSAVAEQVNQVDHDNQVDQDNRVDQDNQVDHDNRIDHDEDDFIASLLGCEASRTSPEQFIDTMMETLIEVILDELYLSYEVDDVYPTRDDILVTESNGKEKFSYHIVVQSYFVANNEEAKEFTARVLEKLDPQYRKFIDQNVNKKIQNFRMLGSTKPGMNRHKVISTRYSDAAHTAALQCAPHTALQPFITNSEGIIKVLHKMCVKIDNTPLPCDISTEVIRSVLDICRDITQGHQFTEARGGLLCFRRLAPTYCRICKEIHHKDNSLMLSVSNSTQIFERCRQAKDCIFVGSLDSSLSPHNTESHSAESHNAESHCTESRCVESAPVNYLSQHISGICAGKISPHEVIAFEQSTQKNEYNASEMREYEFVPTLVVKAQMKLGKTKQLRKYIEQNFIPPTNVGGNAAASCIRFITFRQTFSNSIAKDFPNFTLYSDINGDITQNVEWLIIQVESLHRCVLGRNPEPIDLLVMDEVESILSQFSSGLHKHFNAAFAIFQWMMKTAKHVVCMDANISDRTYEMLRRFRPHAPAFFHWNKFARAASDIYRFTLSPKDWLGKLHESLIAGEKVVVPINSLAEARAIKEVFTKEFPNKQIMLYSSETELSVKTLHFSDVHKYWNGLDMLIYTPTCSAGVSFELKHFDKLFGFFTDASCDVETCRQMIGRVRNIATSEHYICLRALGERLPDTIAEIRRQVYNKRSALYRDAPIQFEYDDNGEIKFYESNYFSLWLENIRMTNLSKNKFVTRFVNQVSDSGAQIETFAASQDSQNLLALLARHNTAKLDLKQAQNTAIAAASDITAEEAAAIRECIQTQIEVPATKRVAYEKYQLIEYYRHDGDAVDATFVSKYNDPKVKRVYANLLKITQCGTVQESLELMREREKSTYEYSMQSTVRENDRSYVESRDLLRDKYIYVYRSHQLAGWLVNLCGFVCIMDTRKLSLTEVETSIRRDIDNFYKSYGALMFEFEIPKLRADKLKWQIGGEFVAEILRTVNKVLKTMYGRQIRCTLSGGKSKLNSDGNSVEYFLQWDQIGKLFVNGTIKIPQLSESAARESAARELGAHESAMSGLTMSELGAHESAARELVMSELGAHESAMSGLVMSELGAHESAMSGLTMSGLTMSGLTMSGLTMSAEDYLNDILESNYATVENTVDNDLEEYIKSLLDEQVEEDLLELL